MDGMWVINPTEENGIENLFSTKKTKLITWREGFVGISFKNHSNNLDMIALNTVDQEDFGDEPKSAVNLY